MVPSQTKKSCQTSRWCWNSITEAWHFFSPKRPLRPPPSSDAPPACHRFDDEAREESFHFSMKNEVLFYPGPKYPKIVCLKLGRFLSDSLCQAASQDMKIASLNQNNVWCQIVYSHFGSDFLTMSPSENQCGAATLTTN